MLHSFSSSVSAGLSSGGTISGDLTITGDLTVTGVGGGFEYTEVITGDVQINGPTGTGAASAGVLVLSTAETTVRVGTVDQLGRIDFQAPSETGGSDAILVGASIHAVAAEDFSSTNNSTALVFSTGTTTVPIERMRITQDGDLLVNNYISAGFATGREMLWGDGDGTFIRSADDDTGDGIKFQAFAGTALMTILDTGNVGIGTTTPDAELDVHGSINLHLNGDLSIGFGSADHGENWLLKKDFSDDNDLSFLRWYSGAWHNTLCMETNTGHVGIGTDDPTAELHVVGSIKGTNVAASGQMNTPVVEYTNNTDLEIRSGSAAGNVMFWLRDVQKNSLLVGERNTGNYTTSFISGTGTTSTLTKSSHGLTVNVGSMVHVLAPSTANDAGYYRVVSTTSNTIVVDRALAGSDNDLSVKVYPDVIAFFATDDTNGQQIASFSSNNKPLQLGGSSLTATGHSLTGEDVLIDGKLEVDGTAYFDSHVSFAANMAIDWGGGGEIRWGAAASQWQFMVDSTTRNFQIVDKNVGYSVDYDHADQDNPTLWIHSVTDPGDHNDEWISLTHNQTEAVIDSGSGGIKFNIGGNTRVHFDGSSRISMSNNDNGTGNTVFGSLAWDSGDSAGADYNTYLGFRAGRYMGDDGALDHSSYNTAVGYLAMGVGHSTPSNNTGNKNVAIGSGVLGASTATNVAVTASNNVAVGVDAMKVVSTGSENVAIGSSAGQALTGGSRNVAIGKDSLYTVAGGWYNCAIGYNALKLATADYNVAVGYQAGDNLVGGLFNTFIGYKAKPDAATDNNCTKIGSYGIKKWKTAKITLSGYSSGFGNDNRAASTSMFSIPIYSHISKVWCKIITLSNGTAVYSISMGTASDEAVGDIIAGRIELLGADDGTGCTTRSQATQNADSNILASTGSPVGMVWVSEIPASTTDSDGWCDAAMYFYVSCAGTGNNQSDPGTSAELDIGVEYY